jgi:hypothetical protein
MPGLDDEKVIRVKQEYAIDDFPVDNNTLRRAQAVGHPDICLGFVMTRLMDFLCRS